MILRWSTIWLTYSSQLSGSSTRPMLYVLAPERIRYFMLTKPGSKLTLVIVGHYSELVFVTWNSDDPTSVIGIV